jgi:Protein of unknown function (DUF4232)
MIKHVRVAALAGAAGLALIGATAAVASQAASAGAAGPAAGVAVPRCGARDVAAGLHGFQALVANRGFILTLTNISSNSCSVDGYAGLRLENAAHHLVHWAAHRGGTYFASDPGARLIVLSPGETASADFGFGAGTGGSADAVATYLLVAPPGTSRYLTVRIPAAPVRIDLGKLFVTAMARHTPYDT